MNSVKIVGLNISTISFQESLKLIIEKAKSKTSSYFCFANVHMAIEAYDDSSFQENVNDANLVCADGMPLVKAAKWLAGNNIERVAGMDMMPQLIQAASTNNLKVFFFGTTEEVLQKIATKAKDEFPKIKIAGTFSPPFKTLSKEEKQEHLEIINKSGADLVFVALGCPKQEKWMAENTKLINAPLLGVGGAFPVYVNMQKRAPLWIRNLSLEWLYRLLQDPKRLFKRYFYTNSKFILLLSKQILFKA